MEAYENNVTKPLCYKKGVINKTRLLYICISLTLFAISFLLYSMVNYFNEPLYKKVTWIMYFVLPVYAFLIISTYKETGIVHLYFIFLVLSMLFYYGQHIDVVFNYNYISSQDYSILDGRVNADNVIKASFLIIQCLLLLNVGYLIGLQFNWKDKINNTYKVNAETSDNTKNKSFTYTAWVFFAFSIIPMFLKLYYQIELTQKYGYLARRIIESSETYYSDMGINMYIIYLSEWFISSLYMLLIAYSKKEKYKWIYLIISGFSIMYLLAGSRFMLLKVAMAIFLIQFIWIKPLNKKNTIKMVLLGLCAIIVFKTATYFRSITSAGITDFSLILSNLLKSNLISSTLWETGITFTSISNLIQYCPTTVPYFAGRSYIGSILIFLPPFLRFGFDDRYTFTLSSMFSPFYYNTNFIGYGSSFIAEGYYNLGYFVLAMVIVLGYAIAKLENNLLRAKINNKEGLFFASVYVLSELLYAIRTDLYSLPRFFVFYVGIPLLVAKLINLIIRKKATK